MSWQHRFRELLPDEHLSREEALDDLRWLGEQLSWVPVALAVMVWASDIVAVNGKDWPHDVWVAALIVGLLRVGRWLRGLAHAR